MIRAIKLNPARGAPKCWQNLAKVAILAKFHPLEGLAVAMEICPEMQAVAKMVILAKFRQGCTANLVKVEILAKFHQGCRQNDQSK